MPTPVNETKMKRHRIGDVVSYLDNDGNYMEGPITEISNEAKTYVTVDFESGPRELTEDEVIRVG